MFDDLAGVPAGVVFIGVSLEGFGCEFVEFVGEGGLETFKGWVHTLLPVVRAWWWRLVR